MCNIECIRWCYKTLTRAEVTGKKVLEVGSYDVNGSLRYVLEPMGPAQYTGVDVEAGPGVDEICGADKLVEHFGKESFDVVVSTCVLEHVRDWKTAVSNIKNVCRPNGTILIIAPAKWPYHAFPYDFWRFGTEDIKDIFGDCSIVKIEEDDAANSNVYAKLTKPDGFIERNLDDYALYSIVTESRVREIEDRTLDAFIKNQEKKNSRKKTKKALKKALSRFLHKTG